MSLADKVAALLCTRDDCESGAPATCRLCGSIFEICETDNKLAVCSTYKAQVMRGRGDAKQHLFNTTNMITHLKSHHPEQHQDFLKSKNGKTQPLLQSFDKARKYSSNHPKVKKINKTISLNLLLLITSRLTWWKN